MTEKHLYQCITSSNYGNKGEIVALEVAPKDLTARQKVMLKVYVQPDVKGMESGKAATVDVEAIKAEGAKEAQDALIKVYEFVTGKPIGNLKKPSTIADKIIEDLEEVEDEAEQPTV